MQSECVLLCWASCFLTGVHSYLSWVTHQCLDMRQPLACATLGCGVCLKGRERYSHPVTPYVFAVLSQSLYFLMAPVVQTGCYRV